MDDHPLLDGCGGGNGGESVGGFAWTPGDGVVTGAHPSDLDADAVDEFMGGPNEAWASGDGAVVSRLVNPERWNEGARWRMLGAGGSGGWGDKGGGDGGGGCAISELCGRTGFQPPDICDVLLTLLQPPGFAGEGPGWLESADTVAQPDDLNPPSFFLNPPHPAVPGSAVGAATGGVTVGVTVATAASLTPDAAAKRFSSFSSRFRSFSRAFDVSFGRCDASISLKR